MLATWFGHFDEWKLLEKVSFQGDDKMIYVHPSVAVLDIRADVYSAWVRWRQRDLNDRYLLAMEYTGLDSIPDGETGDIYFLRNGWKLVVDITKTAVAGVLYSRDYASAYYTYGLEIQYPATVAALVNTVNVGSGLSNEDVTVIVEAVWASVNRTLTDTLDPDEDTIAAAVRVAIAVELGRIDANVSSRYGDADIVPSNVKHVNDIEVKGSGTDADPWNPV